MLPTETTWEKPICWAAAQSMTAVASAPDCETNATWPSIGIVPAKLALSLRRGTISPRQFAQQPHPFMTSQLLTDASFKLRSLGTDFAEAGREDRDCRHSPLTAGAHDVGHRGSGGADDRQLRLGRRLGDARVGLDAADRLATGVDRVDHSIEAGIDQVPQDYVTEL